MMATMRDELVERTSLRVDWRIWPVFSIRSWDGFGMRNWTVRWRGRVVVKLAVRLNG